MKDSVLIEFFDCMAERMRNENDLSDVTWAMLQASDTFLDAFLSFFFPGVAFSEVYIEREKSEDDSRPDFHFQYKGSIYVVENKIYDQNHHFEKYTSTFNVSPDRLGYITNYPMKHKPFIIHTWTEFYCYLKKKKVPQAERNLWDGYLSYIKNVCSIEIFTKPMNLDGMYSLYEFYNVLDEVFALDTEEYSSQVYNSNYDTHQGGNTFRTPRQGVMGKYFDVEFKKQKIKETFGWMGVYFNEENPNIYIAFADIEGWGKPVYSLLKTKEKEEKLRGGHKYFLKPYIDGAAYWFDFKKRKDFNNLTFNGQVKMLRNYLEEVLNYICELKNS